MSKKKSELYLRRKNNQAKHNKKVFFKLIKRKKTYRNVYIDKSVAFFFFIVDKAKGKFIKKIITESQKKQKNNVNIYKYCNEAHFC